MSEQAEKSDTTPAAPPISSEGLSYRDKAMTALKLAVSTLDQATGLLKLYLGLETGAVVVLVKVLTDVRPPTLVLSALAVSIFLFGLSALICLKLVMGVASFRGKMASTILSADPNWQQAFDSQVRSWQTEMKRAGNWMEWLFRLAILFAGLFVVGFLGYQRASPASNINASAWRPGWETIPDKNKKAKPKLSPGLTFADDWLGFVPDLSSDEQRKLHEKDVQQKEMFIQAFRHQPECKGVTFMRSNPKTADFDIQVFYGLDGRIGRWQWVLYRTDITERLTYGEETDISIVAQNVCTAIPANVESRGGDVE